MKFRSTLALFVIVGAIAAYLYFFERNSLTTREKAENALHVVPDFDRDKVDAISIRSPETKIELRKKANGVWAMEDPVRDRADSSAIHELLTSVETLQSDDPPVPLDPKTTKEQLKEYGVSDSTTKAKFTGSGKPLELFVGKDTAVEGKVYLYVEGAKSVRVVPSTVKAQFQKKGDDFRDRKLADFGPPQVTKAEIKGPAGTIELTRKDNHWSITKPLQARGDDAVISDLLASALNAHIDDFGSDLNLASSGLSEPRGTVTFHEEGVETPVVLSIGQSPKEGKDKEKTWARLSSRDALVLVPKTIEKILTTQPDDLRDHNLVRVESDIVDRITIEPAGGAKLVVGRTVQSWVGKAQGKDVPINDLDPAEDPQRFANHARARLCSRCRHRSGQIRARSAESQGDVQLLRQREYFRDQCRRQADRRRPVRQDGRRQSLRQGGRRAVHRHGRRSPRWTGCPRRRSSSRSSRFSTTNPRR